MNYISKIIINNFQSHKHTEIELDKGLNVIVGPSDQGKSAIIRAVKWVLFNEPLGTFFIREGEKECSVTLQFFDGERLTRIRSKNKNLYVFVDKNNKESVFEGFGSEVPQPIMDIIGIKKIYLDGKQSSLINIGEQLEGPFLLSEKTSTRANAIGRLVGVHIVDQAISGVLKDIRNLNINIKSNEEKLKEYSKQLKQFNYLDDLKSIIDLIEDIKTKINSTWERYLNLSNIKNEYEKIEKDIRVTNNILRKLSYIDDILLLYQHIEAKMKNHRYFYNKYNLYCQLIKNISRDRDILTKLSNIESLVTDVKQLEKKIKRKEKLSKIKERYDSIIELQAKNAYILKKLNTTDKINKLINQLCLLNIKFQNLKSINNKLQDLNKRIAFGDIYIKKLKDIDKITEYAYKIKNLLDKLRKLEQYNKDLKKSNAEIVRMQIIIKNSNEKVDKYLCEYEKILETLEICPLCLNKIDKSHINKIINSYR